MRRHPGLVLCALAALLGGCASSGNSGLSGPTLTRAELDTAYMAKVQAQATRTGAQVRWVNPPRRRGGR